MLHFVIIRSRKGKSKSRHSKSVSATPECTCEATSSAGPSTSSNKCKLHRNVPDELLFYEHMEKLREQEYQMMTDTHEKRMKYFKKELNEYLQETAWQYKPIEHYIKF